MCEHACCCLQIGFTQSMSSGSLSGQQALLQDVPLRTQLEAAEAEKGDLELQVAEVGAAAPRLRRVWQTASQSAQLLQHGLLQEVLSFCNHCKHWVCMGHQGA